MYKMTRRVKRRAKRRIPSLPSPFFTRDGPASSSGAVFSSSRVVVAWASRLQI